MDRQFNIEVRDSVFDPNLPNETPRKVYVGKQDGKPIYKVWLYIVGYDLPYVHSVTYILHSTFPDPVRRVPRTLSNPNCQLVIWTWGLFEITVTVEDKSGRRTNLKHKLLYDRELQQSGIKYIDEGDPRFFSQFQS